MVQCDRGNSSLTVEQTGFRFHNSSAAEYKVKMKTKPFLLLDFTSSSCRKVFEVIFGPFFVIIPPRVYSVTLAQVCYFSDCVTNISRAINRHSGGF